MTEPLSPERLAEIRNRVKAHDIDVIERAAIWLHSIGQTDAAYMLRTSDIEAAEYPVPAPQRKAAAGEDVPALLAEVDRLTAEIAALRAQLASLQPRQYRDTSGSIWHQDGPQHVRFHAYPDGSLTTHPIRCTVDEAAEDYGVQPITLTGEDA